MVNDAYYLDPTLLIDLGMVDTMGHVKRVIEACIRCVRKRKSTALLGTAIVCCFSKR